MRRQVAILVLSVFFSLIQVSRVQGIDIPSGFGVVFSDGKDAIYYDFRSGQSTNLTQDLKDVSIKGPVVASEDGKMLVWVQDNKFFVRPLPAGKVFTVKVEEMIIGTRVWSGKKVSFAPPVDSIAPPDTRLSISPNGLRIAYEFMGAGTKWVATGDGISVRKDSTTCVAINILKTASDFPNRFLEFYFRRGMFGNTAFYCPSKLP